MRIIVDASFSGAWVLPDETSAQAEEVLGSILRGERELWVPALWAYEMSNLLLSAHRRKRIEEQTVYEALALLDQVPLKHGDTPGAMARERIVRFAFRFGLSAYDASYLELADRLRAPLHTGDTSLRKAAKTLDLQ